MCSFVTASPRVPHTHKFFVQLSPKPAIKEEKEKGLVKTGGVWCFKIYPSQSKKIMATIYFCDFLALYKKFTEIS